MNEPIRSPREWVGAFLPDAREQPKPRRKAKRTRRVTSDASQAFLGDVDMTPTVDRENLSQWFTDPELARRAARWAVELLSIDPVSLQRSGSILEPAAGDGALIQALLDVGINLTSDVLVDAHEIDPYYVERLRKRFDDQKSVYVYQGDFLTAVRPPFIYDVTFQNPPYENGLDGVFLECAMNFSNGVVAILRSAALQGDDRSKRVWRLRQPGGEWVLPRLAYLEKRPDFVGAGVVVPKDGAKADFCVVQLRRRRQSDAHHVPTTLEWW